MKRIIFTVTNNLAYDQRMIRICTSLAAEGYDVTLVGVKGANELADKDFRQKRLPVFFTKGPGFYIEYNIRLFFWLLFAGCDIICAIDLDTILPVWLASVLKRKKRVYDAHEYFSQQKEIVTRPRIYRFWHWIEKRFVPRFKNGYTVSAAIADAFRKEYGVQYAVIRNMSIWKAGITTPPPAQKTIIYQGAVNEARGFEYLVPAMKQVAAPLLVYGDGNFMEQLKALVATNNLTGKVLLQGKLLPAELDIAARSAYIGINLVEHRGLNQYYSLANKFFDYIHNGLPQVTMNFPEYRKINDEYEVAVLVDDLETSTIAGAINRLLTDEDLYHRLRQNCRAAAAVFNWQEEEKKLIAFYNALDRK